MVITRFAPSPTGFLHIGGLRTALYNYLWARKNNGKFLLRIEDTDLKRNSIEAAHAIEEAFKWIGLTYDGEIVYQSSRFDIYKQYVQRLIDEDKAYYCYMSKEELNLLREEQISKKQRPRYNGKYREYKGPPIAGIEPVVRIKAPLSGEISFIDGVKGKVTFNAEDILDDFVIARSDKTPTYNFTVAIDDALMGVNEVIRGDDHLSNTPKQIVVYNAFGFDIPKFYHVPMINNASGKKLSKRDGAMDVMEYKKLGYFSESLLNFLVRLGWSYGDKEIFSMNEMVELFNPNDINTSSSSFNEQKLEWINAQYIKNAPSKKHWDEIEKMGFKIDNRFNKELLSDMFRDRAKTMVEFISKVENVINEPQSYDKKAIDKFINQGSMRWLSMYLENLKLNNKIFTCENLELTTNLFLEKHNLKLKDIAQPLRISLVGSSVSPSIFEVMCLIGADETIKRISKFLRSINEQ